MRGGQEHHPDGYQPTQFWEHYRRWERKLDVVMRQGHRGAWQAVQRVGACFKVEGATWIFRPHEQMQWRRW
ncbi:MAG: hypothetical protein ACREN8_10745 [Candidatus Dormibacteraceae bacterium]